MLLHTGELTNFCLHPKRMNQCYGVHPTMAKMGNRGFLDDGDDDDMLLRFPAVGGTCSL